MRSRSCCSGRHAASRVGWSSRPGDLVPSLQLLGASMAACRSLSSAAAEADGPLARIVHPASASIVHRWHRHTFTPWRSQHGRRRSSEHDQGERGQVRRPPLHRHPRQGAARHAAVVAGRGGDVRRRQDVRRLLDRRLEGHQRVRHDPHAPRPISSPPASPTPPTSAPSPSSSSSTTCAGARR